VFKLVRIKNQVFERLLCVSVIDGATHTQKDLVQSSRDSLKNNGAEIFVQFLRGVSWF
jgi:hypothetical protein